MSRAARASSGVALLILAREQCHEASTQSRDKGKVDEGNVVEAGEKDVETATAEVTTEGNLNKGEKPEITNTHTFFANMGGFGLRIYPLSLPQQDHNQPIQTLPDAALQEGVTVATVDKEVTAIQPISIFLRGWNDLGKYTLKLCFELDSYV